MAYKLISNFGPCVQNSSENPLNYCLVSSLNSSFNNGATGNTICRANGANCQAFMSDYCSQNGWDDICEVASKSQVTGTPNVLQTCVEPLTTGEILIANTATKKYLSQIGGCSIKYEPFDPTVAGSPMISFFQTNGNQTCVPVYEVDPKTIDSDPVMNKVLDKPVIAWSMLVNMYNTAVRKNTIDDLKGTRLYNFFQQESFQKYIQLSKINRTVNI